MELSLLCDVRVFLFIYDNHQHQNHSANSNHHHIDAKLIHYQSDPRDDVKIIFKQNCNRIFFSNENVSLSKYYFAKKNQELFGLEVNDSLLLKFKQLLIVLMNISLK